VVVALLLLSAAAGMLARAGGAAVRGLWLGMWSWPLRQLARSRTRTRSIRWADAADDFAQAVLAKAPDPAAVQDAARRRNAIALAPPTRPTWMGDRLAAVDARINQEYHLQLVWPRLWLVLPDTARAEIRTRRRE
jgi:hypothetical protein